MRSLTYFALALPALVAAQEKLAKRGVGDMVVATIDGQVQSWVNNYAGPGVAAPSPPPVQPVEPPVAVAPTTTKPTTSVYQAPPTTTTPTTTPTTTTPSVVVSTSSSSSVAAPASTGDSSPSTGSSCNPNQQSIKLTNNSGKDLHIAAGPPYTVGQCGVISVGATCEFCQERNAVGGNLQIGYGMLNVRATWVEGNWLPHDVDNKDFACMDISYIPGYSVPVTCTGTDGSSIGLSDPLCQDEACSNCAGGEGVFYQDGVCFNPMGGSDNNLNTPTGPEPEFFKKATPYTYTFPKDDGVVKWSKHWNKAICIAHPQFGNGSSKRSVESPLEAKSKREAHAHSHMGKKHRRHQHRHGIHLGSKA